MTIDCIVIAMSIGCIFFFLNCIPTLEPPVQYIKSGYLDSYILHAISKPSNCIYDHNFHIHSNMPLNTEMKTKLTLIVRPIKILLSNHWIADFAV